jgi:hypothetical protein
MEAPWSVAPHAQRSVFEVLLPDRDKLWDDELIDLVDAALRPRHALSGRRGRPGTPATVVLSPHDGQPRGSRRRSADG